MPKIFGKEFPPIVVGGFALVAAYVVYTIAFPAAPAVVASKKPKTAAKQTLAETDYLPADYTTKLDPMAATVATKDAFKPLVYKQVTSSSGIPSIDSYTYSGMAQLNNESFGLLENSTTGQGDFVKPGQRWHEQWLIVSVKPDELTVLNDNGDKTVLVAGAAAEKAASSAGPAASAAGNVPVNPMVGPIGANNDLSVQPDVSIQQNGPGRRRGRGGRGGGGRGGGGQGGGGAAGPGG